MAVLNSLKIAVTDDVAECVAFPTARTATSSGSEKPAPHTLKLTMEYRISGCLAKQTHLGYGLEKIGAQADNARVAGVDPRNSLMQNQHG